MTKQTCCGNIEGGSGARPWPDGPSETRGAPQTTKSCYQRFDYQNCKLHKNQYLGKYLPT